MTIKNFYNSKIEKIRQSTVQEELLHRLLQVVRSCRNSVYSIQSSLMKLGLGVRVRVRVTLTADEVHLISRSPVKQCILDPIPTWLLKRVSSILFPTIAAMCKASFTQHTALTLHKKAVVHLLLKKATMDPSDISSAASDWSAVVSRCLQTSISCCLTCSLLKELIILLKQHWSISTMIYM